MKQSRLPIKKSKGGKIMKKSKGGMMMKKSKGGMMMKKSKGGKIMKQSKAKAKKRKQIYLKDLIDSGILNK